LIRPTGAEFDTLYFALGGDAVESEDGTPGSGDYWVPEGFIESFPEGQDTVSFTIETINPNATDTLDILLIIYFTGCGGVLDSSIVEIPIAPPPIINIFAEDRNLICPSDTPFVYGPTAEGGLLPHIYDWFDLEPYPDDQDRLFSAPEDQQEYTVRVTDQCEFRYDTTSFSVINSFPLPLEVSIDPFADPTCPNEPVSLESTVLNGSPFSGDPTYGYVWTDSRNSNYPGLDNITTDNINPAPEAFTPTLEIFLTAIDSCGREASDSVVVNYPVFDSLSVTFTPLFDNCPESAVQLESNVEGGAGDFTYAWSIDGESTFADGFGPSTANTFIDAGSGFNTFSLAVQDRCNRAGHDMFLRIDDNGMPVFTGFDSHDQTIPYIKLDPLPNIITPNGDGLNEVFVVPGINAFEDASVLIYDRWGKLIYENNSYDAGTGEATVSQGFSADGFSDGTYLYIINIDGGECVAQGNLSVVRGNE
ncbi:MAG TPA: gliding motility-associated C-terminal domain-containing protein, partial [Cryomorphaceae bacterium]|nr:gliding motility-associated C-terminal domain-containing protein [Cryomorphaceae bacterium]